LTEVKTSLLSSLRKVLLEPKRKGSLYLRLRIVRTFPEKNGKRMVWLSSFCGSPFTCLSMWLGLFWFLDKAELALGFGLKRLQL
jgi:hypothetical protein